MNYRVYRTGDIAFRLRDIDNIAYELKDTSCNES